MPAKLTKRGVEALRPRDVPFEVRDSELRGLVVRVATSGLRTFWYRYPFGGKRSCRYRLGAYPNLSVDGARLQAKAAAGEVAKGIDPQARKVAEKAQAERTRLIKLGKFLSERFEPWALTHMKSGKVQLARIRSDFADFIDRPMSDLHRVTVEGLRQKWSKAEMKPRTVNRNMQRIASVLSRAVEWGVLHSHPLKGLKPMKTDKGGRVRFLSTDEEMALRNALATREERMREGRARFNRWRAERHKEPLPEQEGELLDHLRPMVLLALNTGMRRGEIFSLRWEDINAAAGIVTVRASSAKSGQTRRIPLNSEAAEVLATWRKRQETTEDLVFPGAAGARLTNVNRSWRGVVKIAKLSGFNFHDLRHSFASKLVQGGTDLNTVRTLLGHSEISTTLIYAHLAPDNLRAAVESVVAA